MFTGIQCFNAIGYIWNVPVIGVVTTSPYIDFQRFIGNPLNLAIAAGHVDFYKRNFTFWDRVCNVLKSYHTLLSDSIRLRQEPLLKKYLGPDIPSYRVLEKNLALLFTNSHYSFYGIKSKTPALIEIGGINIKNDTSSLDSVKIAKAIIFILFQFCAVNFKKNLLQGLKKLLDESDNGFIYFSFGTLTVLESLPLDILDKLYNAFRIVSPVKIIMRAPNPDVMPKNLSDNVFIYNWLPQQKILGWRIH